MICGHCKEADVTVLHVKTCPERQAVTCPWKKTDEHEPELKTGRWEDSSGQRYLVKMSKTGNLYALKITSGGEQVYVGQAPLSSLKRNGVLLSHPPAKVNVVDPEPGFYVAGDVFYRVKVSASSHRAYAMRWDPEAHSWAYEGRSVLPMLKPITAEQAADFGHTYNACVFCGKELTHPTSVAHGYGPICAEKNGLPWEVKVSPAAVPSIPEEAVASAEDEAPEWTLS